MVEMNKKSTSFWDFVNIKEYNIVLKLKKVKMSEVCYFCKIIKFKKHNNGNPCRLTHPKKQNVLLSSAFCGMTSLMPSTNMAVRGERFGG